MRIDPTENASKFIGTSEPFISSALGWKCMKLEAYTRIARGCIPMRIHGNGLCEAAEMQASRVLAADERDDEEDEEDEDEERRHDHEEEEDEEEEETVWTSARR